MCGYTETWSVPANDPVSIEVYQTIFASYLFNISNTSIANISVEANNVAQFKERGEELDADQGRRRMQQSNSDFSFVDWRQTFDLTQLYPERLVDDPLTPDVAQDLYNVIDCSREKNEELVEEGRPFAINGDRLIRLKITFLSESDRGKFACLSLTTRNAMRDLLTPFGMTPCRDRSYICRGELEVDPAPSPPPPDNWQRPPSPPAFVYEVITLASATGGSALFFVISAVCCFGIAGKHVRDRHNSRMIGVKSQRVSDEMPWRRKRWEEQGENHHDDVFRPDYTEPGEKLATGFSFKGLMTRYNPVQQQQS